MAVPIIITVTPTSGGTGGRNLVELKTNNLRLPPEPSTTGPVNAGVQETVRVFFGDVQATGVQVISHARCLCITPSHVTGTVDVKVQNIDDNGDVIVGEEATKANAYTFARPRLTGKSDLTFLVQALILDLQKQVLKNTVLTTHTDYDDTTEDFLNIAALSEMPALILIGPTITENRFYSLNQVRETVTIGGVQLRRVPYTVDLQFTVIGVAELTVQLLNLMAATLQYVNRTRYIEVDCDPNDPSAGTTKYELDFPDTGAEPSVNTRISESNIRTFGATLLIRGFDLEDTTADDAMVAGLTEQITEVAVGVEQYADRTITPKDPSETTTVFPFDDDDLPAAPDAGAFDIVITEDEG